MLSGLRAVSRRAVSRRAVSRRPPLGLLAAGLSVSLLVLLPLGYTAIEAMQVGPGDAGDLLLRPLVGALLLNTLALLGAATLLAGMVGTAAAWFVERTRLPGRRVWAVLAAVPLSIPPFISSFAWVSISPALQSFDGALLVVTSSYYPLVYLPVAAALRGMDPALEETARALGLRPFACFRRVVLPQLRPALLGGMLLVALNTLVEFGAFSLLRFRTFTTEIYAEYRTGLDGPEPALLAIVLVGLCLLCLLAEAKVRGGARYGRIGQGVRRRHRMQALGWATLPVLAGFALLATATLGVPLGMIVYWVTQHNAAATSAAQVSPLLLAQATFSSVWLGLAAAAVTLLLALPLALLATRYDGRLVAVLERSAYLAQGVPGIVVALALVGLTVQSLRFLYQSAALLILAYAVLFLPLALVSARASLMQSQRRHEEAARALGLGWAATAWRITLPLAAPGLGAAAALVFVSVVTELTATLLLAPTGTTTLATQVWSDTTTLAFAAAAPYAALMSALSLLAGWVLVRRFGVAATNATR